MAVASVQSAPKQVGAVQRRWRAVSPGRKAVARRALTVVVLLVAAYFAYQRRSDISSAADMLGRVRVGWLLVAIAAEVGSMVAFARLQRWLLRAGGVRVRLLTMVEIVMAGNAMSSSLPGGAAWSATWAFGQLRRRGADRVLAGWVILVAGALASFAVFVIVAVGSWIAGSSGPAAGLRWVALGLAAIPVVGAVFYGLSRRSLRVRRAFSAAWAPLSRNIGAARWLGSHVSDIVARLGKVRPGAVGWAEVFALAMLNWLYDALCLAACIEALGVRVPWRDILVIYGLTQVSASLPITPGGLGVVEGSLSALLVAYGTPATSAFAVVLFYRIVSFWGLVPLGWLTWFGMEFAHRSGMRSRTHPWAQHEHGPAPEPELAPLGPERIFRPAPCVDCPDPSPLPEPPVAVGSGVTDHR